MGKEQYKKQKNLSLLLVLSEAPNFVIALILAFTTRSLVVFMDLIDSTGNLFRALFMYILVDKLGKDTDKRYNYGVGKIEALSSVCLDIVLLFSILSMIGFAIRDIIYPQPQSRAMWLVVIFKVCCVAGDAFVFYKQKQICAKSDNLVFNSELAMRIKNLVFDSTALVAVFLIFVFCDSVFVMYFSPVVCIFLAVWLIVGIVRRMRRATRELLDRAADENEIGKISRFLNEYANEFKAIEAIYTRVSGGVLFAEAHVVFKDGAEYNEIKATLDSITAELMNRMPLCKLTFVIN